MCLPGSLLTGTAQFIRFRGERAGAGGSLMLIVSGHLEAADIGRRAHQPPGRELTMSGFVKILTLLLPGLALAIGYNAWSNIDGSAMSAATGGVPAIIDITSYGVGLLVGMMLWQIGSVPWSALPARMYQYLMSQMHFYQFAAVGGLCVFVLFYF